MYRWSERMYVFIVGVLPALNTFLIINITHVLFRRSVVGVRY